MKESSVGDEGDGEWESRIAAAKPSLRLARTGGLTQPGTLLPSTRRGTARLAGSLDLGGIHRDHTLHPPAPFA